METATLKVTTENLSDENAANLTEKGQRDFYLIERALQDGDQQAYAELLKCYRDTLYFMMLKMT